MPGYIAPVTVHYTKGNELPSDSNRVAPAPLITISPEIYYANDNVIGYTYNVSLRGYANALRKENDVASTDYGLAPTLDHMGEIRNIFSFNGGNLHIKLTGGISDTILAKGATIKNITFDTSDNKWFNYSPFTVELEFNEIDLIGCSGNPQIGCDSSIFHQINDSNNINDNLINIELYKIKQFNDQWSFDLNEQIYNPGNESISVSYTISAVGKNYYVDGNLIPAWQQAKRFVQQKTREQVLRLINGVLPIENDNQNSCDATKNLSQIHAASNTGVFDNFNSNYDLYNETISCDTSESDGSFSLTYNAILKHSINNGAALHTYTKNVSSSYDGSFDTTIDINGTIQGLIRGGFIYYDFNDFELPSDGAFLIPHNGIESKYSNALNYYNSIGSNTDLSSNTKNLLEITNAELSIDEYNTEPRPIGFSLEHNYLDGLITYRASYSRKHTMSQNSGYSNISIARNYPTDIIQEFIVPGRANGPIIQKLNMRTSEIITINIDGAASQLKSCSTEPTCDIDIPIPTGILPGSNYIQTKADYTVNRIDGSYSASLEFTSKG